MRLKVSGAAGIFHLGCAPQNSPAASQPVRRAARVRFTDHSKRRPAASRFQLRVVLAALQGAKGVRGLAAVPPGDPPETSLVFRELVAHEKEHLIRAHPREEIPAVPRAVAEEPPIVIIIHNNDRERSTSGNYEDAFGAVMYPSGCIQSRLSFWRNAL